MAYAQQQYRAYLRSPRWRIIRWLRKRIDGNRCRTCGETKRLEVHHSEYTHRGKSWWGELMDVITLCDECHEKIHGGVTR